MHRRSASSLVLVLAAASLVACGGGGGGSSAPAAAPPVAPPASSAPVATATAAPTASPTAAAAAGGSFAASDAIVVPTAAPAAASVPVPLPSDPGGAAASLAFASSTVVAGDATIDASYQSAPDPVLPPLDAQRAVLSRNPADNQPRKGVVYLRLRLSTDITFPAIPAFTFTVPGTLATTGYQYWLAFFDPLRPAAGWQMSFEGPATVTPTTTPKGPATTLAFASVPIPLTLVANQTYWLAVVAVPTGATSPTPVPTTFPTRSPEPHPSPVVASPTALVFPTVSSSPQAVTFSESGYTGAFTVRGSCTGIINTGGSSPTFTITPVGPGTCKLIGLGDRGASAVVSVAVAITPPPTRSPEPSRSPEPTKPPQPPPLSPLPFVSPSASASPVASGSATAAPSASASPKNDR